MQVYGPSHLHGVHGVSAPHGPSGIRGTDQIGADQIGAEQLGATQGSGLTVPRDEIHISDVGRFVDQTHSLPEIRADRVQNLRAALANGTYDVESKLDLTVSRILDEIG
jgi:anti-sigma28 factor (negative regulator of flagellin synthesis)